MHCPFCNHDETKVTDAGLVHLKGMTGLEVWLGLSDTKVTDDGLKHLEGFTKLRSLTLHRTQVTEAGVRVNTLRVCSFVETPSVNFQGLKPEGKGKKPPAPVSKRTCHFVGHDKPLDTPIYGEDALAAETEIDGPAIVVTKATTYLIEPGWRYRATAQRAVWFTRND